MSLKPHLLFCCWFCYKTFYGHLFPGKIWDDLRSETQLFAQFDLSGEMKPNISQSYYFQIPNPYPCIALKTVADCMSFCILQEISD